MNQNILLLPRQYSFNSAHGLTSARPRIPQREIVGNIARYYIFQLQDKLRRIRSDRTIHSAMRECNEKFKIAQNQYLETCAYYDELCLRHPMVHSIQEDYSDFSTLHYHDFETRYACRMAEIRLLKSKYAQKLTMLRLEYLSYYWTPILKAIYNIAASLTPDFFCYYGLKPDNTRVTLFILQWMLFWLANNYLDFKQPRDQADQIVSNIECYIDEISMKKPDMYLMMGGPEFTNRLTRNYLTTIEIVSNRREAYYFLLVAIKMRNNNYEKTKYLQLRKETYEMTFFNCVDLVNLVASFVMGDKEGNCPIQIMFTFP